MKHYIIICLIILTASSCKIFAHKSRGNNHSISTDFVPDSITAIKVAEAVWLPIFGNQIYNERPFHAYLYKNKVWIVTGTLNVPGDQRFVQGGTAYIQIRKTDGKILEVMHGK